MRYRNKKILINTPDFDCYGGVASYYSTLKPLLSEQADFFHTGSRGEKVFLQQIRRMLKDYICFSKCLWRNQHKLVLLNPSMAPKAIVRDSLFLIISKFSRKKVIVFIHGWDERYANGLRNIIKLLFIAVYGQADAIIVLADQFREHLKKIGIKVPIYLETTIVENEFFSETLPDVRRNYNDPFNILFLSRIERAKGIYTALEAYQIIKKSYPFVTLTVAGDGEEFEVVKRLVSDNVNAGIDFPGYVRGEQKKKIFSEADCYLFPTSYGEGMPISVLEAMAAGLPVVTRPVGGLKDFFQDRKMGFMTRSHEPKVYAQYIEKLIIDPELCARIGKFNNEYASERFAASSVIKRLEVILKDFCIESLS
jgi:glycosyltransferase involved in cell wall biosynthesis